MIKHKLLLLSVLTALSPLSHASEKLNEDAVKSFKDWAVACNNQLVCSATSFLVPADDASDASTGVDITFGLERGAALDSVAKLSFAISGEGAWDKTLIGEDISLILADNTIELGKLTEQQVRDLTIYIAPDQTEAVLAAAQQAQTAALMVANIMTDISLKGLSAVLLYIDEQQQRLDTPSALLKKGTKAFTAKPPKVATITPIIPPVDATVSDEMRAKVLATVRKLKLPEIDECNTESAENTVNDAVDVLDSQHYLVSLSCGGGAYNSNVLLLVVPYDQIGKAKLAILDQGADSQSSLTGYPSYASSTGLLNNLYKGRGLGDCGSDSAWAWTGQQFTLVRSNSMSECRGNMNFLNVWQLDVAKPQTK